MIVEFVGVPGAGKSTIKGVWLKKNKFIDQRLVYLCGILSFQLLFFLQYILMNKKGGFKKPFNACLTMLKLVKLKDIKLNSGSVFLSLEKMAIYYSSLRESAQLSKYILLFDSFYSFQLAKTSTWNVVFDEGPAQRGVSLSRYIKSVQDLELFYEESPKPDVLIVVNCGIKDAAKRIKNRGTGDVESKHLKIMTEAVETCKRIYRNEGVQVIEINGAGALSDSIQKISRYLS